MNIKSVFVYVAALAIVSTSSAQTLFHDDWEAYRPGTQDWQFVGGYGFGDFDIDLDAGERYPTVVEGAKDGISPYSGNQMYDFRGSAIKGGRILLHNLNYQSTMNPIVDLAFQFAVPPSNNLKTLLTFGLRTSTFDGGSSGSGFADFDLFHNTFKGFGVQPKPLTLTKGAWNEIRIRVDWKAKKTSIFLNWQLLDSKSFVTGQTQPPYSINGLSVGVIANANYSNDYPVDTGIPGMLVDDIRVQAVPEPSTWVSLVLGGLFIRRPRRSGNAKPTT